MRETAKALQAFNDYLAMGADRSLEKLLVRYQTATDSPPSRRLMTLKQWSVAFGWQRRLAAIAETERAAIVAKGLRERENRVAALEAKIAAINGMILGMADEPTSVTVGMLREYRGYLQHIAQELGQWVEKGELTGANGAPLQTATVIVLPDNGRGDREA